MDVSTLEQVEAPNDSSLVRRFKWLSSLITCPHSSKQFVVVLKAARELERFYNEEMRPKLPLGSPNLKMSVQVKKILAFLASDYFKATGRPLNGNFPNLDTTWNCPAFHEEFCPNGAKDYIA
ncbi:hypothetical protein BGZ68_005742 [Mortierella alpina]|nr:hypothetical protein BGZ68_005742 [Mortierella alpina]